MNQRAGVLALQGDFAAHARALQQLGLDVVLVRRPADLAGLCLLALPGGESTTMSMLLDDSGLREPLSQLIAPVAAGGAGLPVLATCAGVILLARQLEGDSGSVQVRALGLLDATVARNSYGRQLESFEGELTIDWAVLGRDQSRTTADSDTALRLDADALLHSDPAFHGVFIRAPRISDIGAQASVAGRYMGEPVLVRQGNIIAAAFHPELSGDLRIHQALLALVE
jgi:5'-phosphate synthase pdxT subunit